MSTTTSTTSDASTSNRTAADEIIFEATPSTKPVMAWLAITVLAGGTLVGIIVADPDMFGGPSVAEIAANVVLLVTVIAIVRLLVKLYVLTRTRYVLTNTGVRREYTLLYRTWSRELPLGMVRGHELTRSRIETLLGLGTVEFLSGSVAGSMGHLKFEALSNSENLREQVQAQLSGRPPKGGVNEEEA